MKHTFNNIISLAMLKNLIYLEYLVKFIYFVLINSWRKYIKNYILHLKKKLTQSFEYQLKFIVLVS
jgi:hypothetical protein